MSDKKPSITLMADTHGRWLWSHDLSHISLPDDTIFQANRWLEKYSYFCEYPDDIHLAGQFNPEGMNLARQVQLCIGSGVEVFYTAKHPDRKVKKGIPREVSIDFWHRLYDTNECSEVAVQTPLSLMDFIMEKCEDDGAIAEIETDHYQQLISMNDAAMRGLIQAVIVSMTSKINPPNKWKNDDDLINMLKNILQLIMCGVMYFPENGGEPIINKPSIMPTEEERQLLQARAEAERATILEVLWEILHAQAENSPASCSSHQSA